MRDLICDVISYCAWSCNVDKINVNDKILIAIAIGAFGISISVKY